MRPRVETLTDALFMAAEFGRNGIVDYSSREIRKLSYQDLAMRAAGVSGVLAHRGIEPSDQVILTCSVDSTFPEVYLGVVLAGAVPCVLPRPGNVLAQDRAVAVVKRLGAKLVIADGEEWGQSAYASISVPALELAEAGRRLSP